MSSGIDRDASALRVAQLRHYPGGLAMERFADELGVALVDRPELSVSQYRPRPSRFPHRSRSRRQLTRLVRYPLAVRRLEADVFHILDQGLSYLAAGLPNDRTVITCHDVMPLRAVRDDLPFRAAKRTLARYRLAGRYLRGAGAVVCVSEVSRRDLIELVGVEPERTSVALQGIADIFRPLAEAERSLVRAELPRHDFLLFHLSYTRHTYKNVPGVISALAALRRTGVDAGLIRVGRPLNKEERALAASLGAEPHIHELGVVSDERLVEVYNGADALLFPSFYEGWGLPVLESMACGTPVVASNCEAIREAAGDAGLLADAEDTEGLVAHLAALAGSAELRAQISERSLRRAESFDWADAAAHYASVYAGLGASELAPERGEPVLA